MEKKLSLYKFTLFKTSESQPDIENQFSSPKNSMSKIKQFSKSNRLSLKVNEKKTYESSENISKIESPFRVSNEFLARFSILEKLGKGMQGVVYKILEKKTQKFYAAKIYYTKDEEEILLINNEVDILSKLEHDNVIKFYEFLKDSELGSYVIITEFFDAITLQAFLMSYNYDDEKKDHILSQIIDCLNYLHQQLIMHRDFNIKNILICPTTNLIKIIDFGLSRRCLSKEDYISPQGNPKYRPPNIYEFLKNPFISDIWNLGIVSLSVELHQKISTKKLLKLMDLLKNPKTNINKSVRMILEKLEKTMSVIAEEKENYEIIKTDNLLNAFLKEN